MPPSSPSSPSSSPSPTASSPSFGPLTGLRVIDMTSVLMGPFSTQLLGDMGADIIKIEAPEGDVVRGIGPLRHAGMGPVFLHANRNKRSVVLNLKTPAARELLLKLAATADVLIYNVRPQAMQRLGLSYEVVAAAKPDIIYAGVYGFGQAGPYAARPAYDDLIQGAVGVATLSKLAGGDLPRYAPSAMADRIVGMAAVNAILAAVVHRQRTGEGQSVEVPMFETMAQFVLGDHMGGASFEPPLGPPGYPRILNPDRRPYATKDGHLCAMLYTDKQWQAFFALIGEPDLLQRDPRFSTIGRRTEHIHELYAIVAKSLQQRTTAEWVQAFDEADIPSMPMNTLESLIDDPHLKAVGFFEEQQHPSEGAIRTMRTPARWSATPAKQRHAAPRLGQHSAEVLREVGVDETQLAALVAQGAVRVAP